MEKQVIIAIDGFSSCGKSTLAKDLAKSLKYKYIDSGAMYRAVALYMLRNNIDLENKEAILRELSDITIDFKNDNGKNITLLNGENVENEIRSMAINNIVSEVALIPEIRNKLVKIQHSLGKSKGIVMDGRDITTVVFPNAEIKIFVTADIKIRTQRRFKELVSKGKNPDLHEVKKNLIHRDHIDSTRSHSPLRKADDAFVLDNTYLNRKEQVDVILKYYHYTQSHLG
jgi:cytidylate kinase